MLNKTQCLICSEVGPGIGPPINPDGPLLIALKKINSLHVLLAIIILCVAVKLIKAAIRYFKNRSRSQTIPHYAKELRVLREENYKTQQEIAYILGIPQTTYARYESGANEMPIRHLMVLCKYYKVSADHILGLNSSDQR